jgi:hypothetical protein
MYSLFGTLVPHDIFVPGGATGELAGVDDKGASLREAALPTLNGVFQELRRAKVPPRLIDVTNPMRLKLCGVTARRGRRVAQISCGFSSVN